MKWLYKYPQREYPYGDLLATNRRRSHNEFEYELIDTGVFNDDHYFDVYVEYAKETPEDILIRISVSNRDPEPATLHVLPSLWFRNTWTWWPDTLKPALRQASGQAGSRIIAASHAFWVWTTSACLTGARRCRPAASSSRPTAPPGWRYSART